MLAWSSGGRRRGLGRRSKGGSGRGAQTLRPFAFMACPWVAEWFMADLPHATLLGQPCTGAEAQHLRSRWGTALEARRPCWPLLAIMFRVEEEVEEAPSGDGPLPRGGSASSMTGRSQSCKRRSPIPPQGRGPGDHAD